MTAADVAVSMVTQLDVLGLFSRHPYVGSTSFVPTHSGTSDKEPSEIGTLQPHANTILYFYLRDRDDPSIYIQGTKWLAP